MFLRQTPRLGMSTLNSWMQAHNQCGNMLSSWGEGHWSKRKNRYKSGISQHCTACGTVSGCFFRRTCYALFIFCMQAAACCCAAIVSLTVRLIPQQEVTVGRHGTSRHPCGRQCYLLRHVSRSAPIRFLVAKRTSQIGPIRTAGLCT